MGVFFCVCVRCDAFCCRSYACVRNMRVCNISFFQTERIYRVPTFLSPFENCLLPSAFLFPKFSYPLICVIFEICFVFSLKVLLSLFLKKNIIAFRGSRFSIQLLLLFRLIFSTSAAQSLRGYMKPGESWSRKCTSRQRVCDNLCQRSTIDRDKAFRRF